MSEEPEHVIASALQWRAEQKRGPEQPQPKPNGHAEPLPTVVAATLAGKQKPRQFLDSAHYFPLRQVVLISGDGGIGKSLLLLQLAIACTTGTQWLGLDVAQGPAIYFSAEEDIQELTNRLNEICEAQGIDTGETHRLHLLPMIGKQTVLAAEQKGLLTPTELFARLDATVEAIAPVALVVDNLANVFAGNENNRTLANHFVTLLRGLADRHDCVLFLIMHPSLTGLTSGTGTSGSTGWGNTARVRGYFYKPDGPDADADDRVFEIKKANYAAAGAKLHLKWARGCFMRADPVNPLDMVKKAGDVDRVREMFACGRWRHDERSPGWGGYAVAEVLDLDAGRDLAKAERSPEQSRNRTIIRRLLNIWLNSGAIAIVDAEDAHRKHIRVWMPGKENGEKS